MKICHIANKGTTCNISVPETEENNKGIPQIAYCKQCSHIALQCSSGHWNLAFARYCTQCGQKLQKPINWDMASANPQRTAIFCTEQKDINTRLNSGVVTTPKIESYENVPSLLVIDGVIILPNMTENKLEAYTIKNIKNNIQLNKKWVIDYNGKLTYGSTPVYYGLHLYSVITGGVQKASVYDGKTELINKISGISENHIEPLPGCAPLKCKIYGRSTLIAGVKNGFLLFDFANDNGQYIEDTFFNNMRTPLSPTLCGNSIVFTTKKGSILSLNIDTNPFERNSLSTENRSFSAPVSVDELVYFEVLNDNGIRSLACFDPINGKLFKAADLDTESTQNLDIRRKLFIHPPLTNGRRLYLSDRSGYAAYIYDSDRGKLPDKSLPNRTENHRFVPHQSIFVNNSIYSAHSSGLTVWQLDNNSPVQTHPLSMGSHTPPRPVTRPVRYGGKLYILCDDRFICRDY